MQDEATQDSDNKFSSVPVEITVCVGKARPSIRELLELDAESVLPLDKPVEAPVDLYIGDQLIARGSLEEAEGTNVNALCVRISELVSRQDVSA